MLGDAVGLECKHTLGSSGPTLVRKSRFWLQTMETSLVNLFREEIYLEGYQIAYESKKAEIQLRQEPGEGQVKTQE